MDNGPCFAAKVTQEMLKRLKVVPRMLTPNHAEGNGLVERFNGTFKKMLHFAMRDYGRQWHRIVPFLVWSLRESSNATTGVSPFMLQYGIPPRRVLSLMKDEWTGFRELPAAKTVKQYLIDLNHKLETTASFANEHAKVAQDQYAKFYNVKAADKSFKVNEQVIVLEKDDNSKTFSRWQTGVVSHVKSPYSY
jgi:transposase InsO family protein